jgi:hypothetical protein
MISHARIAIACAALLCLAAPTAATGAETGEVGGPPTLFIPSKWLGVKALSKPIVIGVGSRKAVGPIEIVARGIKGGICLEVALPKQGEISGSCGGQPGVPPGQTINLESASHSRSNGKKRSEHSGYVTPDATAVTATYAHDGRSKTVLAVLANPGPEILARLHQPSPFAYFVAPFPGCVPSAKVRASAFGPAGTLLGTARGFGATLPRKDRKFFNPCRASRRTPAARSAAPRHYSFGPRATAYARGR